MASSSGGAHSSNEYTASVEHDFSTGGSLSPQAASVIITETASSTQIQVSTPLETRTASLVVNQNTQINSCNASTSESQTSARISATQSLNNPDFSVDSLQIFVAPRSSSTDFSQSAPGDNPELHDNAPSVSLKWSSLMNRYQELSSEIGYTEDMEAKCEQQLASIRARKTLLKEVQQETESMLNDGPQSVSNHNSDQKVTGTNKSSTLPHDSRSALSSPGMSSKSRSSTMSALPPGFEGSSIPLQPKAAPAFQFSPGPIYHDPLDYLGRTGAPFFFPNMSSYLDTKVFKEGQLITVSSESSEESLDDATALEELTPYFGVSDPSKSLDISETTDAPSSVQMTDDYQEVFGDPRNDDLVQEASSDVSALMQRFLKFSEMHQNEPLDNLTIDVNNDEKVVDKTLQSVAQTNLGENSRTLPNDCVSLDPVDDRRLQKLESQTTTTGDDNAVGSSGGDSASDVESLKSEIYVLRSKMQKLVNYTPGENSIPCLMHNFSNELMKGF